MNNVRYVYGLTSALLVGGAAISLMTGYPAGAQVAQNDDSVMSNVVPSAGAPASFADLTEQLQPAVVNIATRQRVEVSRNPFAGTPFADLFNRRRGNQPQQPQTREAQSLGSGFIISADGFVVTNNHVISPNNRATLESITVTMPDGTEYEAELVGADAQSDLAVLKIDADRTFPFVEFGDSSQTRVGEWVIAIGNPFGLGGTVTSGIVSAVYRNTGQGGAYDRYIQTDASINRGNSGGPLFDMRGNVIGINNAIFSPSGGSVGIGFAIPSEIAAPIVEQLKAGQEIERGFLGVGLNPMTDDFADSLGLPRNRGEIIQNVQDDSAADRAGLRPGDIVIRVNGREVTSEQTVSYLVANLEPGASVPIDIIRDGREMTVTAVLGKRPSEEELLQQQQTFDPESEEPMDPEAMDSEIAEKLGLQVLEMTPNIARSLGVDDGTTGLVIGQVDPNSDAGRKGLRRGDIILSAQYKTVETIDDLRSAIADAEANGREAILLRIQRRGQPPRFLPVRLR
ncbi:Do family serine endopeptidase [Erythrobacter sp. THAF29]|uniref:Do family serine endopeptidase n=1 Tax=Erythrobacter sp. THAF29 TaxID=2587851 RepID=UPI0012694BE9|nr:Do family serine endopeptidase [Erythrobacter sp. THAF29]QFT76743.1 putative periplasmic serine endoprotease DegP-like precursor [Erythrobacter sp. THAF29]